nr:TPA_asm: hypothetical protein HUJ06_031397 [Nelumbo nucifera]
MLDREREREKLGNKPVKYHGKWPFWCVLAFRSLFLWHFLHYTLKYSSMDGCLFFILLYYKLPLRPNKKTYYEYTTLWHIYGLLSMNSWFWSAVSHTR